MKRKKGQGREGGGDEEREEGEQNMEKRRKKELEHLWSQHGEVEAGRFSSRSSSAV